MIKHCEIYPGTYKVVIEPDENFTYLTTTGNDGSFAMFIVDFESDTCKIFSPHEKPYLSEETFIFSNSVYDRDDIGDYIPITKKTEFVFPTRAAIIGVKNN